jgi:hypothetical protein
MFERILFRRSVQYLSSVFIVRNSLTLKSSKWMHY